MRRLVLVGVTGLLLAACRHEPIYNVVNHPIPSAARSMSLTEIEKTIVAAGQNRGWAFQTVAPGKLHAVQDQPKYSAAVDVVFDQNTYSIVHASSKGFKDNGQAVHPHYNFWIRNLESDIDTALANAPILKR